MDDQTGSGRTDGRERGREGERGRQVSVLLSPKVKRDPTRPGRRLDSPAIVFFHSLCWCPTVAVSAQEQASLHPALSALRCPSLAGRTIARAGRPNGPAVCTSSISQARPFHLAIQMMKPPQLVPGACFPGPGPSGGTNPPPRLGTRGADSMSGDRGRLGSVGFPVVRTWSSVH